MERAKQRGEWLEWISAGIGALLALGLLGVIGWQATQDRGALPAVRVEVMRIRDTGSGFTVEVEAKNDSPASAAAVLIEGQLAREAEVVATSEVTLDYVPARSSRRAGLFFEEDPRRGSLRVRALGYAEP